MAIKLNRFEEALAAAMRIEKIEQDAFKRKSPFYALRIAETYLTFNDKENALTWLEESVYNRGFNQLKLLEGEPFTALKENDRFKSVMVAIKKKSGLGKPAKNFDIPLLDGKTLTLTELRGKVVLLDFWAVWCSPCVKEIKKMKRYYPELREKGLEIIGVSLDKDKDRFEKFMEKNKDIEWKMSCSYQGWGSDIVKSYKIKGVPSTRLIDKNGKLRYLDLSGDELEKRIAELINEKKLSY